MRLLICAGGTGGGVYPAVAVLQALGDDAQSILWVGSQGGPEASLVQRARIPYTAIPAAGMHGVGLGVLPGNISRLLRGVIAAQKVIREFQPDVLFFTGGYVAPPVALAGHKLPSLMFVPDIEPGLALKFIARFAGRICVTAEASRQYLPKNKPIVVTGYPTRQELSQVQPAAARQVLQLNADLPVLLVVGGSTGARSINRALLSNLSILLQRCQIVHLSGQLDWSEVETAAAALPVEEASRYHPFPYLHEEMAAALASADLVVSRAGASTLGEFPLFGLPAILVPYPYAWRYQRVNAEYLTRQGAAIMVADEELKTNLVSLVTGLLLSPHRLKTMSLAMSAMARPDAGQRLADQVRVLAGAPPRLSGGLAW
ncbi:MAG TPA: undecaprenyldiphospho-muramoylpentapeptide beta-N-acetylglucosaminyltransferase [Levilinea sp.]|nr:undecaprenyldiphospho-muramoylpentapeptide beta-N-acetylglucosaminyltransferase [Levilinea sp.]